MFGWLWFMVVGLGALVTSSSAALHVDDLRCEHGHDPLGIGETQPRLSWKLRSDAPGEMQTAFAIRAASSREQVEHGAGDLWDTGKVASDTSLLVPWGGRPLESRARVFWQVRVWGRDGQPSPWSDVATFELGLLNTAEEWRAQWITADLPRFVAAPPAVADASWISGPATDGEVAVFRREVELPSPLVVRSAVAHFSAEAGVTFFVNGRQARRSPDRSANGWKKPTRADFGTFLQPGRNVLAFSAPVTGGGAAIIQIEIELDDGTVLKLATDRNWKANTESAVAAEWAGVDFEDADWPQARERGPYGVEPWGDYVTDNTTGPGRYLRRSFPARGEVRQARLYATALGVYEVFLNGERVNASVFDPGWTDYTKRVMVQTYDVTPLLRDGRNAIAAVVGDGWYAGRVGWMGLAQYGTRPCFSAQLEITYADGSRETIVTDATWRAGAGEIVGSDQQWGEVVDRRRAVEGWNRANFHESTWRAAVVESDAPSIALDPQRGPLIGRVMELEPVSLTRRGKSWIVDFGQNMVGFIRLRARGPAGTTITVRHGETLNRDGSLYTANLRPARATDTFILRGDGEPEVLEPHFTFHGFRYAEISGFPGTLSPDDVRGIVVSSDFEYTGTFESSDERLNRLFQNIVWGQRGNFLSVPTDCPQRDERMGWLGDAQVFAPTAVRNADVAGFFAKWLVDVNDSQTGRGDFADFAPRVDRPQPGWPAWGDAGVICPWVLYQHSGDERFLKLSYPHMVRWVEYCRAESTDLLRPAIGVGDHLNPRVPTPLDVVATAYWANSARIVAEAAQVLGRAEDAQTYRTLFDAIAAAFRRAFVAEDGTIKGGTQTAYLMALRFGLLDDLPELVNAARRNLIADVETRGHITTGFLGVGMICPELTNAGRSDLAWDLVLQDSYPSWLFSVKHGATTIWERWDGWTEEGGFQNPAMNSFNHYSLGAVGEWLYSGAAGIVLDEKYPGYKRFVLEPRFTSRLEFVKASIESPYGTIGSHWRREGERMVYEVVVPPNTSAELQLPVAENRIGGLQLLDASRGEPFAPVTTIELCAGKHQFEFSIAAVR